MMNSAFPSKGGTQTLPTMLPIRRLYARTSAASGFYFIELAVATLYARGSTNRVRSQLKTACRRVNVNSKVSLAACLEEFK